MDDEPVVLDFLGHILRHIGYDVATSREGHQAIAEYEKAKDESHPFDAVIMDLVISPGMGGQEAVVELKKIDPAAQVIATSGHLDHPAMLNFRAFDFNAALTKPYKTDKLREVIGSLIGAPA